MADPVIISDGGGGGGRTLETFLIIAALAVVGWLLYTRVVKRPAPIKPGAPDGPDSVSTPGPSGRGDFGVGGKPTSIPDEGKIRVDSSVKSLLDSMGGRQARCPPGFKPSAARGGCSMDTSSRPIVETASSPLSVAAAPAQAPPLQLLPVAQNLVLDRPAPVTAPVGVVISTQPAPPQSSPKPATTMLSAAGRPSPVLIAPPPAPKPPPPPVVTPYTPPPKPATPTFVASATLKPSLVLSSSISKPKPATGGFRL